MCPPSPLNPAADAEDRKPKEKIRDMSLPKGVRGRKNEWKIAMLSGKWMMQKTDRGFEVPQRRVTTS